MPEAPSVRPAASGQGRVQHIMADESLRGNDLPMPSLLLSYVYLDQFLQFRHRYAMRDWVMDSGAFSAHNIGTEISLDAYIETSQELLRTDPKLSEVFALDVIGDWKASLKNTEKMWEAGVPAIPTYHYGEPEHVLTHIAKHYPKIALGGSVGMTIKPKMEWCEQCFARVWPKKIHGLGVGSRTGIMALPWHSTDATNWEIGPCRFGRWASLGKYQPNIRGSKHPLRAEIDVYLRWERDARSKWKKEMAVLEELNDV